MKRLRLTHDQVSDLLAGKEVAIVYQGKRGPMIGESYPVALFEATDVKAIVRTSGLVPRFKHKWVVSLTLDNVVPPMLLNAESGGGVIIPLEQGEEDDPEAHGYRAEPGRKVLDAGEAVPHADVATFAESQAAERRYAETKVDSFQKRRARTLGRRVEDQLMKARAHGADVDVEGLEAWLERAEGAVQGAAA